MRTEAVVQPVRAVQVSTALLNSSDDYTWGGAADRGVSCPDDLGGGSTLCNVPSPNSLLESVHIYTAH